MQDGSYEQWLSRLLGFLPVSTIHRRLTESKAHKKAEVEGKQRMNDMNDTWLG